MKLASGNKLCCGRRLGASDPALQANKISGRARARWTKRLSRGAKIRPSAPARCQPRTVSSSLFFMPSWVTPRIDLSALGRSACRISIIFPPLVTDAFHGFFHPTALRLWIRHSANRTQLRACIIHIRVSSAFSVRIESKGLRPCAVVRTDTRGQAARYGASASVAKHVRYRLGARPICPREAWQCGPRSRRRRFPHKECRTALRCGEFSPAVEANLQEQTLAFV